MHRTNAPGADAQERKANLSRGHVVRGVVLDADGDEVWSGDWTYIPDEWDSKQDFLDMVAFETAAHRDRIEAEAATPSEPEGEIAVS